MRWLLSVLCFAAIVSIIPTKAQTNDDNPPWDYGRVQDKMTDHDTVYASLESSDGMYLAIERNRYGLTVYIYFLEDNDRLFFCSHRCTVEMRFDKGSVERWAATEASNGGNKVVHFLQPEALITRLKSAHHLVVEPPVFQRGGMTFEFFVGGLQWPPPARNAKGVPINKDAIANAKTLASPPVCFYSPDPPITADGYDAHFDGTVKVEATVSENGTVQDVKFSESPGYGLDDQITRTLKTWKCKPALNEKGALVSGTMSLRFKFNWVARSSTSK